MSFEGTGAGYDTVAKTYAEIHTGVSAESPLEIALLDRFAGEVAGRGKVTDAGCGTGRIAAYLAERGVDVDGIDLSPGMIAEALAGHPGLDFRVGSLLDLPIADGSRAGVLAWYSTIHLPLAEIPAAYREFARVLEPSGWLLLGFHAGDGLVHVTQSYGHDVDITVQLFDAAKLGAILLDAGFTIEATLVRAPVGTEKRPQGFLLARKASSAE